jgi:hypothetical protein
VPLALVSPTPRSQIRPSTRPGAGTATNSTFVPSGNSGSVAITGPQAVTGAAATSSTRTTACGLPIDRVVTSMTRFSAVTAASRPAAGAARTTWSNRSGLTSTTAVPVGTGRPMSTRTSATVPSSCRRVTSTALTPPRVSTRTASPFTIPRSTRYLATHRTPLPHISETDPSALR